MTEILHNQLTEKVEEEKTTALPGIFLIHGQEMLVEQCVDRLVKKLLAGASRDLFCEIMEGSAERIPDLLAQINTFSLITGPKIVVFNNTSVFESRTNEQRIVEQIIEAYGNNELNQAAKALVGLCGRMETELELLPQLINKNNMVQMLYDQLGHDSMGQLVQLAGDQGSHTSRAENYIESLQNAIEKGFANHHHLIITANAKVPKNLKLYKSIKKHGWIVDCNVPMGERRADRMAQEVVLRQTLENALGAEGKSVLNGVFESLCQLTGFDLRTFSQNVEKLIDYTGERREITLDDVQQVLRRTKNDPIFELTNAVADRNLRKAQFYLQTLLSGDWYPLQILAALTNQIRRLLIAKDFVQSEYGKTWANGMNYQQFQKNVMPAIAAFDKQVDEQTHAWDALLQEKKKSKGGNDLFIAPNSKNPFPVYQTLVKSEKYSQIELLRALLLLNETDVRLKSTGQNPAIVLKKTVMEICGSRQN